LRAVADLLTTAVLCEEIAHDCCGTLEEQDLPAICRVEALRRSRCSSRAAAPT
jgi:hypothetical protein